MQRSSNYLICMSEKMQSQTRDDFSEYPTVNAISRDAAESRVRGPSDGVGGDPCDKLIFITSWVAALSIGR